MANTTPEQRYAAVLTFLPKNSAPSADLREWVRTGLYAAGDMSWFKGYAKALADHNIPGVPLPAPDPTDRQRRLAEVALDAVRRRGLLGTREDTAPFVAAAIAKFEQENPDA